MTTQVARSRMFLRIALMATLPILAIVVAAFATRRPEPPEQETAHQHGVPSGVAAGTSRTVMLSDDAARRIGVTYAAVTEEAIAPDVRVAGQIAFDETRVNIITSRVEGWVEQLYADATGQLIRNGSAILTLYSPMVVAAQEELLLAKRLVAETAAADSATRVRSESMVAAARNRLTAWDVSAPDMARVESERRAGRTFTLRSPASGFIIEKNVVQGQRVMAGDALYRIVDLSRVWLEGEVYEQDLTRVRAGQRVNAELAAMPGASFGGRVEYVSPVLAPETRTARIRVALSNPDYRLKPGMVATLTLKGRASALALTVPRAAILSTGSRNLVFLKRADGMLEPRLVALGVTTNDRVVVLSGLARGDSVVASATFLVDAESSLAMALGGMGDMPGMDIAAPRKEN
jgi:Cu(I)/Ag(I) efflux system membrane fusion protein